MQPPAKGRPPTRTGRGRSPVRWTGWELALITLSVLMIAFPLYAEVTRWIMPPLAPAQESTPSAEPAAESVAPEAPTEAAPEATATDRGPELDQGPTTTARPATPVPGTATVSAPTATSTTVGAPTATNTTVGAPTATNTTVGAPTATIVGATNTTVGAPTATNTTVGAPTATNTTVGVPTVTTVPGNTQVFKIASVSEAAPGQSFSYSISVITTNTTDTAVQMSDSLDNNLEVLSVSTNAGSCSTGQIVSCSLTVRDVNPASVTIQVKVRDTTTSDTVITNVASADGSSSRTVSVRVLGVAIPTVGTAVPTPTGTIIIGVPTSTNTTVVQPPTNTTLVQPPTNTTVGQPPANTQISEPQPGNSNDDNRPRSTTTPPPPPAPPTPEPAVPTEPPTTQPVVAQPAVVRPPAPQRTRTSVAQAEQPSATAAATVGAASTAPASSELFFRLGSDWGSAYPGQEVNFTLVLRNTRAEDPGGANNLVNVSLRSVLPNNLEVLGAKVDRGADPVVAGNEVRYTIDQLAPGEGIEVTIASRIKGDVSAGTLLVAQGRLQYDGISSPIFSNIVSVLVVGTSQGQPAATTTITPTSSPTSTATVTATISGGLLGGGQADAATTTPTPSPTSAASAQASAPAPLPETSGGVPFGGVLLMGMTLFLRTWRLHRARERI